MRMRSKKKLQADAEVTVNVSDETRGLLKTLNGDLQAVREMIDDLSDTAGAILDAIEHEIAVEVNKVIEQAEAVVEKHSVKVPPPPMGQRPKKTTVSDDERVRETPFTRAPRPEQVEWLMEVLADGEWHTGISIAHAYAVDEPHLRYMRRAVGARLREMHEEGLVERRASEVKGAMFEYRQP